MVESTKQVSKNYLSTEKGYADDWAAYIASCHMTAEEALDYIRTTNTQEDRAAHLVDMADFSARSTFVRNGNPWVHCYEEQQKLATTDSSAFLDKMEQLFNAGPGEVPVLGKYRVGESQRTVVSVGTRVMICEEDGSDRPYLLLHLIPVEYLQNTWTFPTEFPLAEISMIVNDGGYVVQSPSLRSRTFLDFIRAYNFPDDYNAVDSLAERLLTTENGLLTYKDSRGVDCYFYYFSFGEGSNIDILGYIPASQIQPEVVEWSIVLLVCGTLFLLFLIDGAYILSIVNVVGSSIARESDDVLYTWAGPEIAVATTKAYSTQLAVLDMVGLCFAKILGTVKEEEYADAVRELALLPDKVKETLGHCEDIQKYAAQHFHHESVFFIGRNLDYALGLEGSLKLKEISYIHSEAYASGELKHGTISLIEDGTLVIALGTYGPLFDKAMSNVVEVKARGADVLALTTESHRGEMAKTVDHVLTIPDTAAMLLPSLGVVPLQLFSYYIALQRGCDIDKPRNLAKSVTVE